MPTLSDSEKIEELARHGHKPEDATCPCRQQAVKPGGNVDTQKVRHYCARYFSSTGALLAVPNIEPGYQHQVHRDDLFGLPAYGASAAPVQARPGLATG